VLRYYKSLDKIPHDPKGWAVKIRGAQSLAQNLCDQRQEAELYRQLATLRLDVELDCSLETLEWKGADRAKLEALCQRLGTQSPLSRVKRYR
jgi:5'-3' exonuclease